MIWILLMIVMIPESVLAATRYVDNTLVNNCAFGSYSISARNCSGSDGDAYNTIAGGVAPTVAGDTLYIRSGTYGEQINVQSPAKNGTAGAPITIGGYPGEPKPLLNGAVDVYGLLKSRVVAYITFQDLILDGANIAGNGGIWVAYGNHDMTFRRLEIKNQNFNGFYIDSGAYNILIEDNYIHDARTECIVGSRWYAVYNYTSDNVTFRRNYVENMPGGGTQAYPGNVSNYTVQGNVFKNVGYCQTSQVGAMIIAPAVGNTVTNMTVVDNIFVHLGYAYGNGTGGYGNGVTVDSRGTTSNVVIANNTFYDLHRQAGGQAYAVLVRTNLESGLIIKNNLIAGTDDDAVLNSSSSAVISNNACLSGKNCGTTGKVTIAAITDCTISTSDFRLKQGTNVCRDAGASTSARSTPVGSVDIGAYEQGKIASAAVVGGYIEATMSVTSPGVQPATGITGFTATCVGCTGTPVVVPVVKAGTQNVIQLTVSGISTNGSCTISLGSTNATDTYLIGGPLGTAQGINSVSGQSVTGTCQNTTGGGGGGGNPSISVSGPSNGDVSVALTYTGTATNCTPAGSGWTWTTDGGTGSSTTSSINITWAVAGTKTVTASNSNCSGAVGSKSVIIVAGGGSDPGALWSDFKLDEGSGTTANDASGLAHHGTVSTGVTWVTGGVTIPTDTTYRGVTSTYGSGVNPTVTDFSVCVYGLPDVTNSQKVVFSSGSNGTSQRWYAGWYTINGQPQWGIGIQGSTMATGSEFVATHNPTLVCIINDSAADSSILSVNGILGANGGSSIKSLSSYTLVGNIVAGNDGTNTINNGGFTIYEMWVYNKKLTNVEVAALYASLSPGGSSTPCLSQSAVQFERVYAQGGASVPITPRADGSIDVIANGGVSVSVQLNCTTTNGSEVSLRPYYSSDGVTFSFPIPQLVGSGNVGMWGNVGSQLNTTPITTCISSGGLSQDTGFTVLDSVVSPTLSMLQNHCVVGRWIIRTGPTAGGSLYIKIFSDVGGDLANGYPQTIKMNIIPSQSVGGV